MVKTMGGRSHQGLRKEVELAYVVVFAALAIVLHIFQYPFPPAPFLKFDLAGVPLAIVSLISLRTGLSSIFIFWLGSIILTTDPTRIVGPSMKALAELATAIPLAFSYRRLTARGLGTTKTFAISFVTALVCRVLFMLLLNYVIAPYWLVWAGWVKTLEKAYEITIRYLPYNASFNAIVVCYVVPISIAVWGTIKKYLHL